MHKLSTKVVALRLAGRQGQCYCDPSHSARTVECTAWEERVTSKRKVTRSPFCFSRCTKLWSNHDGLSYNLFDKTVCDTSIRRSSLLWEGKDECQIGCKILLSMVDYATISICKCYNDFPEGPCGGGPWPQRRKGPKTPLINRISWLVKSHARQLTFTDVFAQATISMISVLQQAKLLKSPESGTKIAKVTKVQHLFLPFITDLPLQ